MRLYETDLVNYLAIHLEKWLTCKEQINHMAAKMSKCNYMLCKL